MMTQSFLRGVKFAWLERSFEIMQILPGDMIEINDISPARTQVVDLSIL